jgi:hypothetical protein
MSECGIAGDAQLQESCIVLHRAYIHQIHRFNTVLPKEDHVLIGHHTNETKNRFKIQFADAGPVTANYCSVAH